ncbi:ArsR/SmtB family transcription factor [Natrialba sp. SSL1]|uniref:ArsR/SmtB family transcription factor n=1 Tax=Natrialba sp. SSL1 TaxID=1869245 RepID=UPI0008F83265|nr:winged helix-turn-helix domain-containing protein [Natrialba sp. SSL1]OIB56376.1 transcriptional regulator [Natrialba sp. SSL1]
MASLFPRKPASALDDPETEPQLVALTDSDADHILSSVSSMTARTILALLYEEPRTASDLADHLDASVQNVSYHLERLVDADLVVVAGTWYSSQGREMDVYAPANGSLVLYAGPDHATPSLASALQRVLGGVGVVGLVSAVVHTRWDGPQEPAPVALRHTEPPEPTLQETLLTFATGPGGFVLAAGLVAICLWLARWYWTQYRPMSGQTEGGKPA